MDLQRAVPRFLLNLSVEGKSPHYIKWCGYILAIFHRWAGPRRITDLQPYDIRRYITGTSAPAVNRAIASRLKALVQTGIFARDEGEVTNLKDYYSSSAVAVHW